MSLDPTPPVRTRGPQQIERTHSRLNGLLERDFTARFLEPYFKRRGYDVENIDNKMRNGTGFIFF
jgi:hypothetical protein